MKKIERLKDILSGKKNIVITSHLNPDGDAVGSSLAAAEWLRMKGHCVTVILPNDAPSTLHFTAGYGGILFVLHAEKLCRQKIAEADVIFSLDYNDLSTRIGHIGDYILSLENKVRVLIDHHLAPPEEMYTLSLANERASSTSYLLYTIIEQMGDLHSITIDIANNLYLGMMTDTGNFSYGLLSGDLYRAVANLVDVGVSPVGMNIQISNQQSENRMRFMGYALSEKMVVLPELKSAYIWFTTDELARFNYAEGDAEGIVNMPLSIAGIVNSAIFIQKPDLIKISLRSQDSDGLDMNRFARTYFIGGGHRNASGGKSFHSIGETIEKYVRGLEIEMADAAIL